MPVLPHPHMQESVRVEMLHLALIVWFLLPVGDVPAALQQRVSLSTNQAALHDLLLKKVLQGIMTLQEQEHNLYSMLGSRAGNEDQFASEFSFGNASKYLQAQA